MSVILAANARLRMDAEADLDVVDHSPVVVVSRLITGGESTAGSRVGRAGHRDGFRGRESGQPIVMNERVSRIAKGAAKRGVSAAGHGAAAAGRDLAKLGARAAREGYDAASIERCPHCGEPGKAHDSVCPHCGREKGTQSQ
jgi:ribosomal protein L32